MITTSPMSWFPTTPQEFLGAARQHGLEILKIRFPKLAADPKACFRAIFYGPPGCGKTELAKALAVSLAGSEFAIEHVNGQSVSVEKVRDWSQSAPYRQLYGTGWTVKIIDEFDRMSQAAVFEMHTHLDRRHPRSAFFMTTNKNFDEIPTAFQTRANLYKFAPVSAEDVAKLLIARWNLPATKARMVAEANRGNVRGALFDAERELDKLELKQLLKQAA